MGREHLGRDGGPPAPVQRRRSLIRSSGDSFHGGELYAGDRERLEILAWFCAAVPAYARVAHSAAIGVTNSRVLMVLSFGNGHWILCHSARKIKRAAAIRVRFVET